MAIVYFWQLFENYRNCNTFRATIFPRKWLCIDFDINDKGCILGHFSQTHLVTLSSALPRKIAAWPKCSSQEPTRQVLEMGRNDK
jgi:hypothetical protein